VSSPFANTEAPTILADLSNPDSYQTTVELPVLELQLGGLMWDDYTIPGGKFRGNIYGLPGQTLLPDYHLVSRFKFNAPEQTVNGEVGETNKYIAIGSSHPVP
jgi:hypothetical protein